MDGTNGYTYIRLYIRLIAEDQIAAPTHRYSSAGNTGIRMAGNIIASRDDLAVEGKRSFTPIVYRTGSKRRTIPDRATVHDEPTFAVHTAAITIISDAADDSSAVIHLKCAAVNHIHTAAVAAGISAGQATHDAAAFHSEPTARFDMHTAAVPGAAAGDDATLDNLFAVLLIRCPQDIVAVEPMLRVGSAVDDGQVADALDLNDAAVADVAHFQHMTVEVNCDCIIDPQRAA